MARQGEAYTVTDGTVWTRYGDDMVVWTPARRHAKAA
jgi:hypothetical protein